jgi:tRNA G18 (ribose-2'-O)-methylase SpoU
LCLLANNINDPANIGSLFRTADALGVEKIYLTGSSPTPPDNKINRLSRSTDKHVAFSYAQDPLDIVDTLKSDGYTIISLELSTTSVDIRHQPLCGIDKVCLVLGSENDGVCQQLLDVSDITVHIPMLGQNSSMNVAVAAAIATFEITARLTRLV